tara:strand:- start:1244 stop:2116 length:873 start_codon:yes stop_codon:yes gene_type:complete
MDTIDMKMKGIIKCTFTASCPAATVIHRPATDMVLGNYDASKQVAWVKVAPIPRKGNVYGALTSVINSTGTKIRDMGLPCRTGGTYIQTKDFEEVMRLFDKGMEELDNLKKVELPSQWGGIVENATQNLGALAKDVTIPTAKEFGDKFSMDVIFEHSPQDIDGTLMEGVATEVAARVRAASKKAVNDMFVASHVAPVQDAISILTKTMGQLATGKRLGQRTIDKVKTAMDTLKDKNWLDLPEIESVINAMAPVASTNRVDIVTEGDKKKVIAKCQHATKVALTAKADLGL